MVQWSEQTKRYTSVIGAGFVASSAAPGVVYYTEKLFPRQMAKFKDWVANRLVLPHLELFTMFSKGLDKAHEKHDRKKREELIKRGEPVEPDTPQTPAQRARDIADALTKSALALGTDFLATYGLLKLSNKVLGINSKAGGIAFVDASVTLGGIALMPTLLAGPSENVHHWLSKAIQYIFSKDKQSADNIAMPMAYVSIPSLLGTLASLKYPHNTTQR